MSPSPDAGGDAPRPPAGGGGAFAALEQSPVGVAAVGGDGSVVRANPAFADLVGRPVEALVGRPLAALAQPEARPALAGVLDIVSSGAAPSASRRVALASRGDVPVWVEVHVSRWPRADDSPALLVLALDITSQQVSFLETSLGLALLDGERVVSVANPALTRLLEIDPVEAPGTPFVDLVHPDDAPRVAAAFDGLVQRRENAWAGPVRCRRGVADLHTLMSITWSGRGPAFDAFVVHVVDLTDSMRTQARLRAAEDRHRLLAEVAEALSRAVEQEAAVMDLAARCALRTGAHLCAVQTYEADGTYRASTITSPDPALAQSVGALLDLHRPDRATSSSGMGWASLEGPLRFELRRDDVRPEYRALMERPSYGAVVLPLRARGRVVGMMLAVWADTMPTEDDEALLRTLADRVALGMDNAILLANARLRADQQAAVAAFGESALRGMPLPRLVDDAVRLAARLADPHTGSSATTRALACVFELNEHRQFVLRAFAGAGPDMPDLGTAYDVEPLGEYTLAADGPVLSLVDEEQRFDPTPTRAWGFGSVASIRIDGTDGPWGIMTLGRRSAVPFTHDDGAFLVGLATVLAGAIRRENDEAALRHQAMHDALTGLPNRALLLEQLEQAARRAQRAANGCRLALLLIDLDRFKLINDSYGHIVGDELLRELATRLCAAVRAGDLVARLGGDEFVVLCEDVADDHDLLAVVARIERVLGFPLALSIGEVFPTGSIGIATADRAALCATGFDPRALLRDADAAMYRAKDSGGGRWEVFDEAMRDRALRRLQIEHALRRAIDRDELRLLYQPVIDVATRQPVSVEALLRWDSPLGYLTPGAFLDVLEESGLVSDVGGWVLQQACRDAAAWTATHPPLADVAVAVNLSARQLSDPDLLDRVVSALATVDGERPRLIVEITESALAQDVPRAKALLDRLRALSVSVAVDDFGTGYSSLAQLKRLPVDTLKVDRSFVDGLDAAPAPDEAVGDSEDRSIVASVVALAQALGLTVVAEGVETHRQLEVLADLGCDRAQGYLVATPMPSHDLPGWLREHLRPDARTTDADRG